MNNFHFSNETEKKYALACLEFAKIIGLIDDSSLDAVEKRCKAENEKRRIQTENGETVYGLVEFPLSVYLDYELTRIKLDFASEKKKSTIVSHQSQKRKRKSSIKTIQTFSQDTAATNSALKKWI